MAVHCEGGGKDEVKTQFMTREGLYKLMSPCDYPKPSRSSYNRPTIPPPPVKMSFVTVSESTGPSDRICFNFERDLFVYVFKGLKKATDLSKPIDKRSYKGSFPTCHDFDSNLVSGDSVSLLVGFSAGQVQIIDPIKKDTSKLYNEERLIDKTKVTCLKWLPSSSNLFLVSHSSGQMYVYKDDLPCGTTPPHYQIFKQGEGFCIYTCKTKSTRNPLYRWVVGEGAINEFAFSPCTKYLAIVSQDGFLRVFNYNTMDLVGLVRSYFGGLLCVCWSPDSKYVVTGGEDDLVTVWSLKERRVVARGLGHKSWVSVVAFDSFTTYLGESETSENSESGDEFHHNSTNSTSHHSTSGKSKSWSSSDSPICYRFGSVSQDTQLCLWDLTEDILKHPVGKPRTSVLLNSSLPSVAATQHNCNSVNNSQPNCVKEPVHLADGTTFLPSLSVGSKSASLEKEKKPEKEHKRNFSLTNRNSDKNSLNKSNQNKVLDDPVRLIGTSVCPKLSEVPMLEPLVCKKITHERLTSLTFKEDSFVTACHEGSIYIWARPGKSQQPSSSPNANSTNASGGGGTEV